MGYPKPTCSWARLTLSATRVRGLHRICSCDLQGPAPQSRCGLGQWVSGAPRRLRDVRRERAIQVLTDLRDEAETGQAKWGGEPLTEWKAKVRGVLASSLGPDDDIVKKFSALKFYYSGPLASGMDLTA